METKNQKTAREMCVYDTPHGPVKLSAEIIRKYLVNGEANVTEQEIMMFMTLCKFQGLNPFLKEAYLIKYSDRYPATIVVGKDVFTKRASKNPNCNGWKAGIIVQKGDEIIRREGTLKLATETIIGGWATVLRKDWKEPLTIEVSLDEYIGLKDGKPNLNWAKRPATMIRKVAVVQALRDAFPEDLQGMYVAEEVENNTKIINTDTTDTSTVDDFLEAKPESEKETEKPESKPEEIDSFKAELGD